MLYQGTHAPLQSGLICQLANRARSFSVVRRGTLSSETRTDIYKYTPGDRFTGHNLTDYTDPNGNTTHYDYYPGGGAPALTIPTFDPAFGVRPDELIKDVIEGYKVPATTPTTTPSITRFGYNFTAALSYSNPGDPTTLGTRVVSDPRPNITPTIYMLDNYGATTDIDEPLGKHTHTVWAIDHPDPAAIPIVEHLAGGGISMPGIDVVLLSKTDALGRTTSYKYDALGNVIEETIDTSTITDGSIQAVKDASGKGTTQISTHYTYDPLYSKMTSKTDAEQNTTTYTIDPRNGDLLAVIDALGETTTYTYQVGSASGSFGAGDLKTVTDPRGKTTTYMGYDRYGNALTIQDADGNVTTQQFDERSRMLLKRDTFGHHTEYGYDMLDRKVRETKFDDLCMSNNQFLLPGDDVSRPWAEETLYSYLPHGEVQSMLNSMGQETDYAYDGLNRLVSTSTFAMSGVSQAHGTSVALGPMIYAYDEDTNLVMEKDYRGIVRKHIYDDLNRRIETDIVQSATTGMTAPVGLGPKHTVTQAGYDLVNNKRFEISLHATAAAPTQGNRTDYIYDGLYRVVETDLPFPGAVIETGYDLVGNKIFDTDANRNKTLYTCDTVYRLKSKTDAEQNAVLYDYDKSGNVVRETHKSKSTTTTVITYDDGVTIADGLSRPTTISQLVYLGDPTNQAPSVTYTTSYFYDDSHNRVIITDPRGNDPNDPALGRIEELRDGLDRLHQHTVDWDGANAPPNTPAKSGTSLKALNLVTQYTYDADGNQASITDPEKNTVSFTFDGLNRKVHTQYPLGLDEAFGYDGDNNLITYVDKRHITFTTAYDDLNRMLTKSVNEDISVPIQILIGFFPKLRLYGFEPGEGGIPKLLGILEEAGATALGDSPHRLWIVGMGLA
jgi:YD repeat-containing protein